MENKYRVELYKKDKPSSDYAIKYTSNDVGSCNIELNFFEEVGIPYKLTSEVITITLLKPNGTFTDESFTITGDNTAICTLNNFAIDTPGKIKGTVKTYKDGDRLTWGIVELTVIKDTPPGTGGTTTNEFTVLNQLVGKVGNIVSTEDTRKYNEAKRIENESIRAAKDGYREKDYESLKKIIINENQAANLQNQINNISVIRLEEDIQGTSFKKGDQIDVCYLQLIQSQKYASVQWKLQNDEIVGIACQGDSLTYGHDISSGDRITAIPPHKFDRAKITYPEALQTCLNEVYPGKVVVENRGYSGDCCESSYRRWTTSHSGDLTIIMLGTNDSRSGACQHVGDIQAYLYWYEQLIVRELLWGKAIMILKSPRTLWANDKRVEAFSNAVELLASKYNIPLIDTTQFVSSYELEIWSDLTIANVNKICTHFSSKGYPLIGAGVASTLMGESIVNKKLITSGDTLLAREQVDGVKFIANTIYTEVDPTYTPLERSIDKSIVARMGNGSKIAYSFYTDEEDLLVIPTVYCYANKKFKMTLDFGQEQPFVNLTTKYEPQQVVGTKIPGIFEGTSVNATLFRKSYFRDMNVEPLRIVRKGWHTLIIESDDCVFHGLEFISYNEFQESKKRFSVKNVGGGILSVNFDGKYAELIGKISVSMPNEINVAEITTIPTNFIVLNRFATITNKLTKASVAIYTEDNKNIVEVFNQGTQHVDRVAMVDYRLYGYYN